MTEPGAKQDVMLKLKTIVTVIITTGIVISGVWAFFFVRTMALKDEKMELLEDQNAHLCEFGAVPEAVKKLEQRLIPLTLAFAIDPFNGRVKVGAAQENPTEITMLIIKAEGFRKERKFDLAAAKLSEIEDIHSTFQGLSYFRFLIERDKNNTKEALAFAEQAIDILPEDSRVLIAYEFAVKANLQNGNKKKAEELCLSAMRLNPKNDQWQAFFRQAFGYEPSVPKE